MVLLLFIRCCCPYCERIFVLAFCMGVFSMQTFILMRKGELVALLCVLRHFMVVPSVGLQSLIVAFLCHLLFLQNIL